MPIAVVIDGAYFLRRFKNRYPSLDPASPKDVALGIVWLAAAHMAASSGAPLPNMTTEGEVVTAVDSQLILVAGDADFVPAVKLARREGIDVVLDPMGGTPAKDLIANVDGVRNIAKGMRS